MPELERQATEGAPARWVRAARTNLRRRMARSPIAFAMSGGGSQGSFETGVLRFLYDDLKLRPAILCGSSVGSIIAAKLAEGDDPDTGRRAIDEIEDIWRGLRSNDDMWLAEPWLEKLRSQANWAAELRGRAAENGTAGSQARVVLRMLSEVVRHPPETDGTLDALRQAMRARSLLSKEPVRHLVETHIDPERVAASGIMLRIGAVGLESGELRYITEHGEVLTRDGDPLGQPPVSLTEAILASASIPLVFPPTRLGDEHYVDGGVREILPLELAFNRLGAGHIFAVVASTPGRRTGPGHRRQGTARARAPGHRGHRSRRDAAQGDQPAARVGRARHRHRARDRRARRAHRRSRRSSPRRSTTATCAPRTSCSASVRSRPRSAPASPRCAWRSARSTARSPARSPRCPSCRRRPSTRSSGSSSRPTASSTSWWTSAARPAPRSPRRLPRPSGSTTPSLDRRGSRSGRALAADQRAGAGAGVLALDQGDLARDDGRHVAVGLLDEAARAAGEVVGHVR